jgi:predicted AlkP superfamily phosphohydrolase/phosphomutase
MARVLVVGLDCVPPRLAFELYRGVMPNLSRLMDAGVWGPLQTAVPPITVPAWACLLSGYDPGELGLYGFRNRVRGSYQLELAHSGQLARPLIWERLRPDQRVCCLFVPPSFPPRPVRGDMVSCFLTPDADSVHTYPQALAAELSQRFGPYLPDVEAHRTDDRARLLEQLYACTSQHFAIACHMQRTRRPDLTVMVDIGPDRFHHGFWADIDPLHPRYDPEGPYRNAGIEYYSFLDRQLGLLLEAAGHDHDHDVNVLVISDHGARALHGCVHINEWLIRHGYLVLSRYPSELTTFSELEVDWSRTRAFGEGGYYSRVILNIAGREPQGIVAASEASALCAELTRGLSTQTGPDGRVLKQRVLRPQECYRAQNGLPPDLMVFWDDLNYRSSGAVGGEILFSPTNDTGPDACNHDWHGIFVLAGPDVTARGARSNIHHEDVAVTVLSLLGQTANDLPGRDRSRTNAEA